MFLEEVVETEESPRPLLIFGLRSNEKFQELFGSKGTSFVQTISIDRWPLKTGDVTKVLDLILD
jgi:hypothetical protein